ncbi:protein PIR-like [Dorcoceras hygrometricum]|uniref:Protein PIR-like n=1 Tax=Dorcoceras hygrometricum TaxID=472368 RepID=A0A2Z7DC44_9LAMI|nr:protein PIR-like [Dorcoceras hygrometricum]
MNVSRTESPRRNSRNKSDGGDRRRAAGGGTRGAAAKRSREGGRRLALGKSCEAEAAAACTDGGDGGEALEEKGGGAFRARVRVVIKSTTIGKSRVAKDPIAMRTSWRSNSDIASVTSIGYPHMSASGESSTTMHRLLHASGSHPIPPPDDPKTNQYNQDLGLIHSTNGNHLESPNEGSSIDHQVTIYLHAQNITMFSTNETWKSHFHPSSSYAQQIELNFRAGIEKQYLCDPHVGDPDPPPGCLSVLPRWHLCLAPTGVSRTRLFSVDCGSYANPVHDQI